MLTEYILLNYLFIIMHSKEQRIIFSVDLIFHFVIAYIKLAGNCQIKYLILSAVLFFFISSHYLTYSIEVLCKIYIYNNDNN